MRLANVNSTQLAGPTLHNGRDLVQSLLVFAACDVAAMG